MKKTRTSPAKKKYTVLADCNSLVCQTVMATSPEEAYRIADEDGDAWESASGSDDGEYRLHHRVWDAETDEFINVAGLSSEHCKTCGSEIVETVNDSNFRDGECGPCEHERYKSQAALLEAAKEALMILSEIQCDLEDDKGEDHCITLLDDSINAYGHAK